MDLQKNRGDVNRIDITPLQMIMFTTVPVRYGIWR
ncbi:unknown [Collinsella sp. CAG:289]|nr:unknown [Collinsella sp. CAG:289]